MSFEITVFDERTESSRILIQLSLDRRGRLYLDDYSHGPAADSVYGEGSSVEQRLIVEAADVAKLRQAETGRNESVPGPALAQQLAQWLRDTATTRDALDKFRDFCRERGVEPRGHLWIDTG